MNKEILNCKKHIHFIGIGGSGMYPLVQILHTKGYYITGSDNNESETLQAVRDMGIPVMMGQRAENIEGADLIVYTAAIMADNPELIAAKEAAKHGVDLMERSELHRRHTWQNNHHFHDNTDSLRCRSRPVRCHWRKACLHSR